MVIGDSDINHYNGVADSLPCLVRGRKRALVQPPCSDNKFEFEYHRPKGIRVPLNLLGIK